MVTLGVIGTGSMGSALVKGWMRESSAGVELVLWDKVEAAVRGLAVGPRVRAAGSMAELVEASDLVFVVVKPKDASEVLGLLARQCAPGQIVVSAMAGLSLSWMRGVLGPRPTLFRIMPNLAVEFGAGAVVFCGESDAPMAAVQTLRQVLEPLGLVLVAPEPSLDVVTAVSGSGPAFVAVMTEAMEDGAVAAGLSRVLARVVVRQGLAGLASELLEGGQQIVACDGVASHREAASEDRAQIAGSVKERLSMGFEEAVCAALERSRSLQLHS